MSARRRMQDEGYKYRDLKQLVHKEARHKCLREKRYILIEGSMLNLQLPDFKYRTLHASGGNCVCINVWFSLRLTEPRI
jgi:hypothetical protein